MDRPKQLLPIIASGKSLLQVAIERIDDTVPTDRQWLCTSATHAEFITATLGFPAKQIIGEPIGRDTLNAVALSAAVIALSDPDAVMAVLTADHLIEPVAEFIRSLELGYALVERDPSRLVSFIIKPDFPATGYGYVEKGAAVTEGIPDDCSSGVWTALRYTEKPDLDTARAFLASGRHGWSSGMFCFHVRTLLDVCRRFQPVTWEGVTEIADAWQTPQQHPALCRIYPSLKKISVDYAIMEPASQDPEIPVLAVEMDVRWLDVGSWSALAETVSESDRTAHNRVRGPAVLNDCSNMLVINEESRDEHLIAAIGCDDLIIVHTADATLVCPRGQAQKVKELAERLDPRHR